jgi:hypothetical protein
VDEMCKLHPDVPRIVRESTSVNGGHIGWGCAVCNMLKLQECWNALRMAERELPVNTPYGIVQAVRNALKPIDYTSAAPSQSAASSKGGGEHG